MMTRRVSYREIGGPEGLLARQMPFEGNSMSARFEGTTYTVYSYRTPIARVYVGRHIGQRVVWIERAHYSQTTSRHQGLVRAWLDVTPVRPLHAAEQVA